MMLSLLLKSGGTGIGVMGMGLRPVVVALWTVAVFLICLMMFVKTVDS